MSREELQGLIDKYRMDKEPELLMRYFGEMTRKILEYKNYHLDHDIAVVQTVIFCMSRLSKFDEKRGNAFLYFSTIINCYLRQCWRSRDCVQ